MVSWARWLMLGLLLSQLGIVTGCRNRPSATTVVGPRIVSTDPSATQILVEIGAGRAIVGVSPWDKPLLPESMRNLPVVGGYLHLDEELVIRLAPTDLILQQAPERISPGIMEMARKNGIHIVNIHINTFHQLYATATELGRISGCSREAAVKIQMLKKQVAALARSRPQKPVRVVYIISTRPIRVVGADNFMDEEITLAGGVNVAERCGGGFPAITRETLVQLAPQVLLISEPGQPIASGGDDPRLASWLTLPIAAAKSRRIDLITWKRAQMLTLRVGHVIDRLRKLLQSPAAGPGGGP